MRNDVQKNNSTSRSRTLPPAKVQAYANNNGLAPTSHAEKPSTYEKDSSYRAHQEMLLANTDASNDEPRIEQTRTSDTLNMSSTKFAPTAESAELYFYRLAKSPSPAALLARTIRQNTRG